MPNSKQIAEMQSPTSSCWYAVYTRSRHEKQVAQQLDGRRIETFLPLCTEVHRWKDRFKKVEVPIFSSYVFAQFPARSSERLSILKTPGVVRIVGFGQEDAPVPEEQIAALRRVLESEAALELHRYLRVGQRVKIISGSLAGIEGILTRVKNSERLVIAIDPIRRAVSVELAGYEVVPIRK